MTAVKGKLQATVVIPDDVLFRELQGEAIILNLATGVYFGLDEIGSRIWAQLAAGSTLEQVVDVLWQEFDVDRASLEADVIDLVDTLAAKNLVALAPGSPT